MNIHLNEKEIKLIKGNKITISEIIFFVIFLIFSFSFSEYYRDSGNIRMEKICYIAFVLNIILVGIRMGQHKNYKTIIEKIENEKV
jgi:hypothetical protein